MADSGLALETLLLFQSVASHGATEHSFARIAESLKTSTLLQRPSLSDDRFDALTLTNTYLRLLKAEAKAASQTNGATEDIPSPKLATVEDASAHFHLVPRIIPKLYTQYKDKVVEEIRNDERKYEALLQELAVEKNTSQVKSSGRAETPQTQAARPSSRDKASIDAILNEPIQESEGESANDSAKHEYHPVPPDAPASNAKSSVHPVDSSDVSLRRTDQAEPATNVLSDIDQEKSAAPPTRSLLTEDAQHGATRTQWAPGSGRTPYHPQDSRMPQTLVDNQRGNSMAHQSAQQMQPQPWLQSPYGSSPHVAQQQGILPNSQTATSVPNTSKRAGGIQLPPFSFVQPASHQSTVLPRQGRHLPGSRSPTQTTQGLELQKPSTAGTLAAASVQGTPVASHQSPAISNVMHQDPSVHYSPGSSTGWRGPLLPEKHRPRSISPVSDREASPPRAATRGSSKRKNMSRESRIGKIARGNSKTPSIAATSSHARTRSQSITSLADDASVASTAVLNRGLKSDLNTPTPSDRLGTRPRRGRPPGITAAKRKRGSSIPETPVSASGPPTPLFPRQPQQPPDTIVASRNFHKTTAPLMDHITSHKHASLFANPVTARTKGYYDDIRRPTDFKSIRIQIGVGSRAVAAAAATEANAGSPSGANSTAADAGTTVSLPYSTDLEPPKAIVNAAQLEQELMRMFANAVMFNEGDDGVVADTREMFGSVEADIQQWRDAEVGHYELSETDPGASVKRRRP